MIDLPHRIHIRATLGKVFEALSTPAGLSWWCPRVERSEVGLVLQFDGRESVLRMRVEAESTEVVRWTCTGDLEDWAGTTLRWDLIPVGDGVDLAFVHAGWRNPTPHCATTNTRWGQLLHGLKARLEA